MIPFEGDELDKYTKLIQLRLGNPRIKGESTKLHHISHALICSSNALQIENDYMERTHMILNRSRSSIVSDGHGPNNARW